jgi:cysteine synthase A
MLRTGEAGSIVTMICDPGERYLGTYYDRAWLEQEGLELAPYIAQLESFATSGKFAPA